MAFLSQRFFCTIKEMGKVRKRKKVRYAKVDSHKRKIDRFMREKRRKKVNKKIMELSGCEIAKLSGAKLREYREKVESIVEKVELLKCGKCGENGNPGQYKYCEDCEIFACEVCCQESGKSCENSGCKKFNCGCEKNTISTCRDCGVKFCWDCDMLICCEECRDSVCTSCSLVILCDTCDAKFCTPDCINDHVCD